jgi:ABC-type multidrug transport system ATPase subunit
MSAPAVTRAAAADDVGVGPAAAMPEQAPALLELSGITKRWPRLEAPVLDGVDLVLRGGTTTWIGGRNGIGKTTLMRIGAGLIGCDGGRVTLDGLEPFRDRRVFQSRSAFLSAGTGGLYARLTVGWHLNWWGRLALLPAAARRRAAEDALRRFDLEELKGRRVDRMSMGQRQRLRLAGTFLHKPEVILLDEPHNSLDAEGLAILDDAIAEAVARGAAACWCAPTGDSERHDFDIRLLLEHGKLVPA